MKYTYEYYSVFSSTLIQYTTFIGETHCYQYYAQFLKPEVT